MDEHAQRELEHRLQNWAWVVREGLLLQHCASFEHHYRPPRDAEERRDPKRLVDVPDGWLIERAWRQVPAPSRWLLKLHFVRSMPRAGVIRWVLKRTGYSIKTWTYKAELACALRYLQKSLDIIYQDTRQFGPQFEILLKPKSARTLSGVQPRQEKQQPAQA